MSTDTTNQTSQTHSDPAVALDRDLTGASPTGPDLPEDVVEVRRDGPLSAVVAVLAGAVAVLYLVRAVSGGSALDWVLALGIGAVAAAHAAILVDSRAPLMVLDAHGVRTRRGRVWEGIAWGHVARVEHTPRASVLRDGRLEFTDTDGRALAVRLSLSTRLAGANWHELTDALVELADGHTHVVERAEDDEVEALEDRDDADHAGYADREDSAGGTESRVSSTSTGATALTAGRLAREDDVFDQQSDLDGDWLSGTSDPVWARPSTGATAPDADLQDSSDETTSHDAVTDDDDDDDDDDDHTAVRPAAAVTDDTGAFAAWIHEPSAPAEQLHDVRDDHDDVDSRSEHAAEQDADTTQDEAPARDLVATPAPLRDLVTARRSEVLLDRPETPAVAVTPGHGTPVDAITGGAAQGRDDLDPARTGSRSETTTIVFDDAVTGRVEPEADPVIGNELAAARTRLGLGIDQLAARTRIRPHVIEAIEVDDFGPCGGDFYARGHLRTLGRVLGVDPEPLVETYEERYSDAPIDPKRVFSSELAAGPGSTLRSTRGGFNWSVLVACVMAVVLVWSLARLLTDGPVPLADQPVLQGTPGRAALSNAATTVPVTLTAADGGASVIVRDGSRNSKIVFKDDLAFGQTAELDVVPPVRISSTDGGVEVSVDGQDEGALGETGQRAEQVFVPED